MLDRSTVLTLFRETAQILVFNLDFLPDEKLGWKPAPDAKSALEIVNHLAPYLDSLSAALGAPPSVISARHATPLPKFWRVNSAMICRGQMAGW